ncbi:hypothetical protein H4I96_07873 [Botrytis cinerea]
MRTLPWKKKNGSTTLTPPKKTIASVGRSTKRPRGEASPSDSDYDSGHPPKQIKAISHSREPSTSPPPEPPTESFMEEGREHDDKYRIVEDEFLTVAKSFTVHLHTAEYKRLGLWSAECRMQQGVKQKRLQGRKNQRNVLEKLIGKKEDGLSDDSDEETLPFVGTSLYGLMTSPKKRAAAGFRSRTKFETSQRASSPTIKRKTQAVDLDPDTTASEDNDDLDAPISAPKFSSSKPVNTQPEARLPTVSTAVTASKLQKSRTPVTLHSNVHKSTKAPTADPSSHLSTTQDRIARRIAQTKLRRKQAEEEKKKLDIIPTFL